MFGRFIKHINIFLAKCILLYLYAFSLDQFNSLPNNKILHQSKLKAFADDKNRCDHKIEIC